MREKLYSAFLVLLIVVLALTFVIPTWLQPDNGEDYEEGAAVLREYVQKWPQRGLEARKQYVVLHTVKEDNVVQADGSLR